MSNPDAAAGSFDAIIVGGGHNGLATAAYLGKAGYRTLVLEARHIVGGAAVTEEFHPGFRNSVCSYVVGLLSPDVIRELGLVERGLTIVKRPCEGFYLHPDGSSIIYTHDRDEVARQLDALCPGDAAGYQRLDDDLMEIVEPVRQLMNSTPPNLGGGLPDLLGLLRTGWGMRHLSARAQETLSRAMTMSVADFLAMYLKGELICGALGYLAAVGNMQSPHAPGSAYVLLHHSFGEANGKDGAWGHAIGGMGAISNAIAKAAQDHGATILTNAKVARIITRNGTATGVELEDGRKFHAPVIASNINPKLLYGKLLDPADVPEQVTRSINAFRCRSGTFRMNVALSELPDFTCRPGKQQQLHHGGSITIAPSIDYLEQAYDDAKGGGWARKPVVEMWISSTIDPTLAPEGKHVASLFCQHFAPELSGGRDWDDVREEVADLIIDTVTDYAPNFRKAVLGRQILSPKDLERIFGLVGGDIFHGCLHLDQIFSNRPVPGFADYRSPVRGLYLCGSGAHPGGGVTGIPGRNASREIIKDLRRRRIKAA